MPTTRLSLYDAFVSKPYNVDDLVLRAAELLKLELTLDPATTDAAPNGNALSRADAEDLFLMARTGQATAIRKRLLLLKEAKACPVPFMNTLQEQLENFDLEGMVHHLESARYD